MKPEVTEAIEQIRVQFSGSTMETKPDQQGGAYVMVDPVDLGDLYTEETRYSWIGFHLPFSYPFADIYPHHVRRDLSRCDGKALSEGMSLSRYEGFGRDSVQLSRRSNHRDASIETALHKLLKVIEWAKSRK